MDLTPDRPGKPDRVHFMAAAECPHSQIDHAGCYEAGRRAGREDAVRAIEARITELERQGPSLLLTAYRLAADLAQGDQPRTIRRAERRNTDGGQQ